MIVPQLDGAAVEGATSDDAACERAVTVDRARMAGFISSLGAGATVTPHAKLNVNVNVDQDSTVTNATSAIYLNICLALCKMSYNHLASTVPDSSLNVTMPSLESTRSALNNQPVSPLLDIHPFEVTSSITEAFKKTPPSPPSHQVHLCILPSSTAALGSAPHGGES